MNMHQEIFYLTRLQRLAGTLGSLSESNVKNSIRPEAHPIHIVDGDTAEVNQPRGRYSGGNQS